MRPSGSRPITQRHRSSPTILHPAVPRSHERAARRRPALLRPSTAAWAALGALLAIGPIRAEIPAPTTTVPYPKLDHVQGTLILTAAAPVRPLLLDEDFELWAVNTDLSTVERFTAGSSSPVDVRQVPWGPVSIAEWDDPAPEVPPELLVVCRNTWGLLRMDKETGAFHEFIPLPAEPSDIAVDPVAQRAFVSCTGADAVVQIDLQARDGKFHVRYDEATTQGRLRLKSPYFLSLDQAGKLRVAPLHSGNNTTATNVGFADTDTVISLSDRTNQLPDEDLFVIDPTVPPSDPAAVRVEATGVGTILFAHGENPADGRYWMLNTDAKNAPAGVQSEPALHFDFVDNRLTILDPSAGKIVRPFDPDPPSWVDENVVGQPFALAFDEAGNAFVAGLLTDNVTMLDVDGSRIALSGAAVVEESIALPQGSIPRGLALMRLNPTSATLVVAVYCWGTARVEVYLVNRNTGAVTTLAGVSLSNEPLPADLREGRQIFFDGSRSARKNVSCASCHVDAGTDFLAWNLSGLPFDDKGPMVTQTLVGLERVSPFHWRGERTLEDFNLRAFPNLLGNTDASGHPAALPAADFAKLKAWLFALRNPANPFQDRNRVVQSGTPPSGFVAPTQTRTFQSVLPAGLPMNHPLLQNTTVPAALSSHDAVNGLDRFRTEKSFQDRFACSECHAFPVGTDNDVTDDEGQGPAVRPERLHFKNAPFHEIWRKKQSLVLADTDAATVDVRPFLGTGVAHAGKVADLARFVQPVTPLDPEFVRDVAAFIQQFDQGLAPAAHYAHWLSAGSSPSEIDKELKLFLLPQASSSVNPDGTPNCDIAILQAPSGGPRRTWYLDRSLAGTSLSMNAAVFVVDSDSAPDTRSMQDFVDEAADTPSLVVGLPVGMAERFAVDFDMDGKRNRDDTLPFTVDPAPDSTLPSVQARLGRVTTNSARLWVVTDEPTTLEVDYKEQGMLTGPTLTSPLLSRVHSLMLTDLRPSTDVTQTVPYLNEQVRYDIEIRATDATGVNETTFTDPTLVPQTEPFEVPTQEGSPAVADIAQIVREHLLTSAPAVTVGAPNAMGRRLVNVSLEAAYKQGAGSTPAEGRVFVVRAFRVRGGGDPVQLSAGNGLFSVVSGSGTAFVGAVEVERLTAPGTRRALDVDGTMIINSVPTGASGTATLAFRVSSPMVQSGDVLMIGVEAVVEADPGAVATGTAVVLDGCSGSSCATATIMVTKETAFSQWDFPRTTEARLVGSDDAP